MTSEFAATIAPAEITPCTAKSEVFVRVNLAKAVQCTTKALYRLVRVNSEATDAEKQKLWDAGLEKVWFAHYEACKLTKIKETFERIHDILTSPNLKVVCDPNFGKYAEALPGIRKIRLGRYWLDSDPEEQSERIQTFIHEAAHIAGRTMAKEWYGKTKAKTMAGNKQANRPMMVTRSAENYGYYAIEVAESFGVYLWA